MNAPGYIDEMRCERLQERVIYISTYMKSIVPRDVMSAALIYIPIAELQLQRLQGGPTPPKPTPIARSRSQGHHREHIGMYHLLSRFPFLSFPYYLRLY